VARIAPGVFCAGLVTGCEVFVDAGGVDDWPCAGIEVPLGSAGAVAAAGAAGEEAGAAIAFTALRQGDDNLGSLRKRHSRASAPASAGISGTSLPPGCTLAQLAMKSERQAARTASRCACVGCCAAVGVTISAMRQPATSEDLSIEPSLA
jgi:hypothetical protein